MPNIEFKVQTKTLVYRDGEVIGAIKPHRGVHTFKPHQQAAMMYKLLPIQDTDPDELQKKITQVLANA